MDRQKLENLALKLRHVAIVWPELHPYRTVPAKRDECERFIIETREALKDGYAPQPSDANELAEFALKRIGAEERKPDELDYELARKAEAACGAVRQFLRANDPASGFD